MSSHASVIQSSVPSLNDYARIVGQPEIGELWTLAKSLENRTVNSLRQSTHWPKKIVRSSPSLSRACWIRSALTRAGQLSVRYPALTGSRPAGVIQAYKMVKQYRDCQWVLAGGSATDDPEGAEVFAEVQEAAKSDSDIFLLNLPPQSYLEINALQRASTIVVQKSLREGFGLTVTEALWKKKPVVASAVGGIFRQVLHKVTGMLVHSVEGCAYQIRYLFSNRHSLKSWKKRAASTSKRIS